MSRSRNARLLSLGTESASAVSLRRERRVIDAADRNRARLVGVRFQLDICLGGGAVS